MLTLARNWPRQKYYPRGKRNITDADGRSAETRMDIGSPTRARTWDLRINSPAGHRPESRASQRSWPRRPVIFSAGLPSFPLRRINSAPRYYRASSPLRTQICEPATIWFVALATNARRASLRPMIPQRSREGSRRSAEDLASRAAF